MTFYTPCISSCYRQTHQEITTNSYSRSPIMEDPLHILSTQTTFKAASGPQSLYSYLYSHLLSEGNGCYPDTLQHSTSTTTTLPFIKFEPWPSALLQKYCFYIFPDNMCLWMQSHYWMIGIPQGGCFQILPPSTAKDVVTFIWRALAWHNTLAE